MADILLPITLIMTKTQESISPRGKLWSGYTSFFMNLKIDPFKHDLENFSERFFPRLENIYMIFSKKMHFD